LLKILQLDIFGQEIKLEVAIDDFLCAKAGSGKDLSGIDGRLRALAARRDFRR
jgi:hypothetical protein